MRSGRPVLSAPEHDPLRNVHDLRHRARASSDARAYGGPAHGEQWTVDLAEPPPWVELPTGSSSCLYRLARHPHTGRPARDHRGNLLYVPFNDVVPPTDSPDDARILAFPGSERHPRGGSAAPRV